MAEKKIIVLTPVKNEDWIIEYFLKAASEYADVIIIGDHFSSDKTVELAEKFPKVEILRTQMQQFSEPERRNELMSAARQHGHGNILIALDADEMLTPSFVSKANIEKLKRLPNGTRISLPHLNVLPNLKRYWRVEMPPIAFVDDGESHDLDKKIHFPRVPNGNNGRVLKFPGEGIIHLQYIDWKRMESKHRWYRVWEKTNIPSRSQLEIFRRYNHMNNVPLWKIKSVPEAWEKSFRNLGIELSNIAKTHRVYWWDSEVTRIKLHHPDVDYSLLDLNQESPTSGLTKRQISFVNYLRATSAIEKYTWFAPLRILLRFLDMLVKSQFN